MTTVKVATHSGRNGSQRGENPLKSKVATGRNTLSIYYVYMRAAFGAAARIIQTTKIEFITPWLNGIAWCVTTRNGLVPRHVLFNGLGMMVCVSRHCPANHQFTTPLFILATTWWSTKQRVRFVVSRVVSFIGLNVVVCSVNHLSLILTNDRWSQCPVIDRGGVHAVGGYAFALCGQYYLLDSKAVMALSSLGSACFSTPITAGCPLKSKLKNPSCIFAALRESRLLISSIDKRASNTESIASAGKTPSSFIRLFVNRRGSVGIWNKASSSGSGRFTFWDIEACIILSSARTDLTTAFRFACLAASSRCLAYRAFRTCVRITPPKPITPTIAVWNSLAKLNQSIRNPFWGTVQ